MEQLKKETDNTVSSVGREAAAGELGCGIHDVQVVAVNGGYSRNRRSLVGHAGKWIFAKEVDHDLLLGDGIEEMRWLHKDFGCTDVLRPILPEVVPEWGKLTADSHVLLMPSYRVDDGWLWSLPPTASDQYLYIQTVVDAIKKLEVVNFDQNIMDNLNLNPYLRDKLALDDGLGLILKNEDIRNQLKDKYDAMKQDDSLIRLRPAICKMCDLLQDKVSLDNLSKEAASLINQPNDCFGHCDVRSDNIAFSPLTGQVKFVDWNWASFAPSGFGATEFLIDAARHGASVEPWVENLNKEMLAATVGFYAKRCLEDPLAPGNTLRDMQAQSAAVALYLHDMVANR